MHKASGIICSGNFFLCPQMININSNHLASWALWIHVNLAICRMFSEPS